VFKDWHTRHAKILNGYTMKAYLLILSSALLVIFGQPLIKWRASSAGRVLEPSVPQSFAKFTIDLANFFAYVAGFIANLGWLYVVTKLPLTIVFPICMGVTFVMILLGSWFISGKRYQLPRFPPYSSSQSVLC
jgi:hypothetical protein